MKNSLLLAAIFSVLIISQSFGQTRYTRIGIMGYEKMQQEINTPEGISAEPKWIVPPLFLESERRFLKFFTLGTEINFSKYGVDIQSYGHSQKFSTTNLGMEVQGKLSIPVAQIFEVYGQLGIGYSHSFIKNSYSLNGTQYDQNFGIGYIMRTTSIGGSIIFGESIGLFIEAGIIKGRSVKTNSEIYDDSLAGSGFNTPRVDLGPIGDEHATGQSPFVKIGVVFQIEKD